MLIRPEQMRALETEVARSFENRMLARIGEFFPRHISLIGESSLRLLIGLALTKARGHALSTERNVALYLDLMCLLGSSFDDDPQMRWAEQILTDPSLPSEDARADTLHARGWDFGRKIAEDFKDLVERNDSSRIMTAFREISRLSVDNLPADAVAELAPRLCSIAQTALPARCALLGEIGLHRVVSTACESAERYVIRSPRGVALFTTLGLVVGAGFDRDPQLPWVSRALTEPVDPISRTRRLHRDALHCLRQWWNVGEGVEA